MVTFGPENRLWGYDSFVAEGRYPKTTFSSVASFLGADYDEEFLKTLALDRFVLNEFVEDDRGCIAYQTFSLDSKEETTVYYAEELVAMILNYGRKLAEAQAEGQIVRDAVITIPSYFGQEKRHMMMDAAELAGLNVI